MSGTEASTFAEYDPAAGQRAPTPSSVLVRPATPADLAVCAALIVSRTGGDPAQREQRLLDELGKPERHHCVADSNGEVVGYAGVMAHAPSALSEPDVAPAGYYLIGLIIDSRWRRRGIGELLTVARMDWVRQRAAEVWYFASLANGATLDLHERLGFQEVSRAFSFPGSPLRAGTGVLLRAPLHPPSPVRSSP